MAKLYTLDEKLLTDTPEIRVKDKLYLVDNRQKTVRKLMQINTDQMDGSQVSEQMDQTLKLALGEAAFAEIDKMDLPFPAYQKLFELVMAAMTGVRAAIVPIMASAALNLVKGAFRYPPCVAVAAASFALYLIWDVNCVFLVLMGIAAGLAICEVYERRGGNGDGVA